MILVVGSTGLLGGEVCRLLLDQGHDVRALVRSSSDPDRVEQLRRLGAHVVVGDLEDPASLQPACAGIDAVVSTATAAAPGRPGDGVVTTDGQGQVALVDAAQAAGVRHFVFVSFSGNLEVDTPFTASKRRVERHLQESGMTWTILRPTAFMEIWLSPHSGFDVPGGQLAVLGSGGAPTSYVSLHDVARFCMESLSSPFARNRTIEVGGPDAMTPLQVAKVAEEVTGRAMNVSHIPVEALQAQFEGGADPLQKSFAGLMLALASGDAIDMRPTLQHMPLRLRTVRSFLEQAYGNPPQREAPVPG